MNPSAEIDSHLVRIQECERRLRLVEKRLDVVMTPWYKRLVFALDGWPTTRLVDRPQWRPWRRWWTCRWERIG